MKVQTVLVCTDYNDNKANPTVHNSFNDQKYIDTILRLIIGFHK